MRSKEVSDAIDLLENGIADYIIEDYCIKNEYKLCGTYCEKMKEDCIYNQAIDKVIEYIETLEQLPNKIRDKIKELETEKSNIIDICEGSRKYTGNIELNNKLKLINAKIQVLKEL